MIRNFIYLDEYKMYSLSSQIFEGITEFLINDNLTENQNSESQKGPVGSGRILADVLRAENRITEKKYLHDYSYTIFEQYLLDEKKVLEINSENAKAEIQSFQDFSFVKVKAKATFNDINSINKTLKEFNNIGKALAHVTNFKQIEELHSQLEKSKNSIKDRNKRAIAQRQQKSLTNISKLAKDSGLTQNQKFLDDLSYLLSFGFQDQFEIQLSTDHHVFSANLKREELREPEDLLMRKYSRKTEKEFVVFGVVTQSSSDIDLNLNDESGEYENIKEALMNLVAHLTNMEMTFTGRLSNEIIIDPIAVYTEL